MAPGETGATRDIEKAIAAWDRRLEALKASQRAVAAQPIAQSASGSKVDPHAPLVFAGYHLSKKRGSKSVRNMKEYEQRLNFVMAFPPIARLKHVSETSNAPCADERLRSDGVCRSLVGRPADDRRVR